MGRLIELAGLKSLIKNNQRIFVGTSCAEPRMLIKALREAVATGKPKNLQILVSYSVRTTDDLLAMSGCSIATILPGAGMKSAIKSGQIDYFPGRLSQLPDWFRKRKVPIDVALVQVSPPDESGYCSLGISVDYTKAAIEAANLVIAEINPQMPKASGDTLVHSDELDYMVSVDYEPSALESSEVDSVTEIIGQKIVQLIPEHPTLQVGIGGIGDAVAMALLNNGRRDIRLHTGMLSDAWMRVIQAGKIQEPVVATMVMGSQDLYQYINLNPQVCLYPCDYTHNPLIIAKLPRFCAINFALEVDLTGQINAETLNGKQISGMGGQADFVTGATLNPEGTVIMALPSTARGGTVSRIVSSFHAGSAITTLRSDVDYVVTEYGVAKLAGMSADERRNALIKIAHPKFRSELEKVI